MKTKTINPGETVEIKTKSKTWEGQALESYDPSIILLKLDTGYNIGIRENEIITIKVLEKAKKLERKEINFSKNKKLRNVAIIITGGTISSRLDPKTGGVISTDAEEILNIAPEIKDICNVTKIEKPFLKFSEDMNHGNWKKLAETAKNLLNDELIDGLIITHGTDTLHYTAAALSFFMTNLNKPIAITYSQRSIDRGSTDAHLNLLCAAQYATSDIAEIALIGHKDSDDSVCLAMSGTKTRKMHTSRRDAFKIINDTPLAEITKEKITILKNFNARDNKKQIKTDTKYNENVALVTIFPGSNPDILDFYESKKYKGLILQVTGLGQVPGKDALYNWIPKIKKIIQKGIIVCAVPQTLYGRLNPNVYSNGRELQKTGIIFLEDMLPETALVKLGWALGHKSWDKQKIKDTLLENISNEFNDRIEE